MNSMKLGVSEMAACSEKVMSFSGEGELSGKDWKGDMISMEGDCSSEKLGFFESVGKGVLVDDVEVPLGEFICGVEVGTFWRL